MRATLGRCLVAEPNGVSVNGRLTLLSRVLEVSDFGAWLLRRGDQIVAGDLHMTYIAPLMIWLLVTLSASELRSFWLSGDPAAVAALAPRRNAPCPCGSGRKFKHCCERAS